MVLRHEFVIFFCIPFVLFFCSCSFVGCIGSKGILAHEGTDRYFDSVNVELTVNSIRRMLQGLKAKRKRERQRKRERERERQRERERERERERISQDIRSVVAVCWSSCRDQTSKIALALFLKFDFASASFQLRGLAGSLGLVLSSSVSRPIFSIWKF